MCFNFESSITAWFLAFFASLFMLSNGNYYDAWLPLFILVFTQIQIIEAIIWTSMSGNTKINSDATRMVSFLLWLQPFLSSFIGWTQTGNKFLLGMTCFFGFVLIYHWFSSKEDSFISTVGPNGHLIWHRYGVDNKEKDHVLGDSFMTFIYMFGLFVPFLFMPNPIIRYGTLAIGLLTFGYSMFNYSTTKEFSSMWCFTAVSLAAFALIFDFKVPT